MHLRDRSDKEKMKTNIEKIKKYPKQTQIYSGHGINTTLEQEIQNNPFFK